MIKKIIVFVFAQFLICCIYLSVSTKVRAETLIGSGTETQPALSEDGSNIRFENVLIQDHLYRFDISNNNFDGFWIAVCETLGPYSYNCAGSESISSSQVSIDPRGNIGYPYTTGNTQSLPENFSVNFAYPRNYGLINLFTVFKRCWINSDCSMNWALYDLSVTHSPSITKTIFVPGFGASWNADAFASCTPDNNPDHWSLASYAESVYNPILSALSQSGWNTIPFYYDWRQQIPSNSTALSDKINSSTTSDEKVNIVGHSMGGLVAADYLTNHDKGIKTESLLTVGSPLKGAVQAYPAWAGGDIWEDNFITKIAMTLYLKHCGPLLSSREAIHQFVPSVQNLLPTFDYLRDSKTGAIKSTSSLLSQNNWLPLNFVNNFWGVKFGTLTGSGQSTLSEILIKGKTKKDLLANWSDGKPEAQIYSNKGDGTVLLESGKFDEEHNITITQNHSGLVDSVDGMTEILKFLGKPIPNSLKSTQLNTNSALVVIGYPSAFWVTNQDGKREKDKDGMVSFINPKSGSYKLNLLPKTNNTLFAVAQFLPNGEVKYKEYNLRGLGPKLKTIKLDLQNPIEDPLY